jgi:hypothetical protein
MSTIVAETLREPARRSMRREPPWKVATRFPPQGASSEEAFLALQKNRLAGEVDKPRLAAFVRFPKFTVSLPTAFGLGTRKANASCPKSRSVRLAQLRDLGPEKRRSLGSRTTVKSSGPPNRMMRCCRSQVWILAQTPVLPVFQPRLRAKGTPF